MKLVMIPLWCSFASLGGRRTDAIARSGAAVLFGKGSREDARTKQEHLIAGGKATSQQCSLAIKE